MLEPFLTTVYLNSLIQSARELLQCYLLEVQPSRARSSQYAVDLVYVEWQVRRRVAELEVKVLKRVMLGGGRVEGEKEVVQVMVEG